MQLLLATRNRKKIKELTALLQGLPITLLTPDDFPELSDVEEDGETFRDNALKKARAALRLSGQPSLADDSGLEVDALGGRPGVFSARYAGRHGDDRANYEKVLTELETVRDNQRRARFHCVLALALPPGVGAVNEFIFEGTCEGIIAHRPTGSNGFGYDPIFFVTEKNKTMAELNDDEKNAISHRARALKKLRAFLSAV